MDLRNVNKEKDPSQVIFGVRPVEEALAADKELEKIMIERGADKEGLRSILSKARQLNIPITEVPIQKMNNYTRKPHQGIIAFLALVTYQSLDNVITTAFAKGKDPFIIALDQVTDVRNFGAIARTAEAFGLDAIVIPQKGGAMINGDAMKTSAGALNHIAVCREKRLSSSIDFMRKSGLKIIACTEKSNDLLNEIALTGPLCIVLGAEDLGISEDILRMCDEKAGIPMLGQVSSLNVSVSAGIALYECIKQRS